MTRSRYCRLLAAAGVVALLGSAAAINGAMATVPMINLAPGAGSNASGSNSEVPDVLNHEPAPSLRGGSIRSVSKYHASPPYGSDTRWGGQSRTR